MIASTATATALPARTFRAALAHGDEHVRGSARLVLERMGAEVVELADGAPLAALLDGPGVELVIASDEHGGVDALRDCRRRGGTIPFVILAREIDDVLWCAIELRLVSLVTTPFVPETLVAAVRSVCGWTAAPRASA